MLLLLIPIEQILRGPERFDERNLPLSSLPSHVPNFLKIHGTGSFLPWHRLYVQTFENELGPKCEYASVGLYWDWTQGTIMP